MDAIKKKMQAMKVDKDGALERALVCEQEARDANTRAEKVSTQPCNMLHCPIYPTYIHAPRTKRTEKQVEKIICYYKKLN